MNNFDLQELQRLRKENEELKALLEEGKALFENFSDLLSIKKFASMNLLLGKLPIVIRKIQDNPDMMDKVLKFIEKLKKYESTGNTQ